MSFVDDAVKQRVNASLNVRLAYIYISVYYINIFHCKCWLIYNSTIIFLVFLNCNSLFLLNCDVFRRGNGGRLLLRAFPVLPSSQHRPLPSPEPQYEARVPRIIYMIMSTEINNGGCRTIVMQRLKLYWKFEYKVGWKVWIQMKLDASLSKFQFRGSLKRKVISFDNFTAYNRGKVFYLW